MFVFAFMIIEFKSILNLSYKYKIANQRLNAENNMTDKLQSWKVESNSVWKGK